MKTVIWENRKIVLKTKNNLITKLTGYITNSCQCYSDCDCQKERLEELTIFRVSGKTRQDHIPKPFDFESIYLAECRINELNKTT